MIGDFVSTTYNISVTYEIVTEESAEHGDAAERGFDLEREEMDLDELERLIKDRGFSEPSSSRLDDRMWFSTSTPLQDRAYFEDGESKFYSLHINSVNGETPTIADYADVARMARIKMPGLEEAGTRIPSDDELENEDAASSDMQP